MPTNMNNIKITTRHIKITADVKQHLQSKLDSLKHYFDRIKYIEVILDHNKDQFVIETIVSVIRGKKLFSKISDYNYIAAINNTTSKIETQLLRFKEKIKKTHRKPSFPTQEDGETR